MNGCFNIPGSNSGSEEGYIIKDNAAFSDWNYI